MTGGHVHAQLFPYVLNNTTGMTLLKVQKCKFYCELIVTFWLKKFCTEYSVRDLGF